MNVETISKIPPSPYAFLLEERDEVSISVTAEADEEWINSSFP